MGLGVIPNSISSRSATAAVMSSLKRKKSCMSENLSRVAASSGTKQSDSTEATAEEMMSPSPVKSFLTVMS